MTREARDVILLGLFFVVYGAAMAVLQGVRLPTWPRVMIDGIDAKRLRFAISQRDAFMTEEGIPVETRGVVGGTPPTVD